MMVSFLAGATCFASAMCAMFFLRFWRETGDRLFAFFALAFAIFAVNRLLLTALHGDGDGRTVLYTVRAAAFSMILLAIIDKNRSHDDAGR